MPAPIAIQLYTVRDVIAKSSFAAVVKQIADIGYAGVEPAGFPGTTPQEAAKVFKDLGLQVSSGHFPLPVGDKEKEVVEAAAAIGCQRLVSGFGPDDFKTVDRIQQTTAKFNAAVATAAKHGLTFGIHNHWWEFLKVGDRYAYEIMLDALDPRAFFEVDVYWVQTGGPDPAAVVQKLGKRAPLLHIKDGPCKQGEHMTAVGAGKVNMPAVVKAAGGNAAWLIVELDSCATDMMTAVRESYAYLSRTGLGRGRK